MRRLLARLLRRRTPVELDEPRPVIVCARCGLRTTSLEVQLRRFHAGACARCGYPVEWEEGQPFD